MANTLDTNIIDLGGYNSTYDTTMSTSGIDTITLTGSGTTSITSPITTYSSPYTFTTNGTSGSYLTSNNTWTTGAGIAGTGIVTGIGTPSIQVKGDADFDGDVKLKGKSLTTWMETMEKRLAILVPDPKKLEKFEALQKAYNHYKMLEALCDIQDDPAE